MDRVVNDILRDTLFVTGDGWLSEEDEVEDIESDGVGWIIDPIDGTREYIEGIPEFAVSIAGLSHGTSIAAVLNPSKRDLTITDSSGCFTARWNSGSSPPRSISHTQNPRFQI